MAAINLESVIRTAVVFHPEVEGWSETVNLFLTEEIDGYTKDKETGEKTFQKVKDISFFIGDIIAALSTNPDVAAFLAAKSRADKVKLVPVLLANAKMVHECEHDQQKEKMMRKITSIEVAEAHLTRIQRALDGLFGI